MSADRSAGLNSKLAVISILQVGLSFLVQVTVLVKLGATAQVDTYLLALIVPQLAMALIFDPMRNLAVPLMSTMSPEQAADYARGLAMWGTMAGLLLGVLMLGVAHAAAAVGLYETSSARFLVLYTISLLMIPGAALSAALSAYGQASQRYVLVAAVGAIPYAFALAGLYVFLSRAGIVLAAWAQVFVVLLPGVLLLPLVLRRSLGLASRAAYRELARQVVILTAGSALGRAAFAFDRVFASQLAPGSVAILDFAVRSQGAVTRVLNQSLVTPAIPPLARALASPDRTGWQPLFDDTRRTLTRVSLGIASATIVLGIGLMVLFAGRDDATVVGEISRIDLSRVGMALAGTAGVVVGGTLAHLFTNAAFAMGRVTSVAVFTLSAVLLGIVLRAVGVFSAGLVGIAVAVSVAGLLQAFIMASLWRKIRPNA